MIVLVHRETLLNERVPQMRRLPGPPLMHFVRAWTHLHAHPSACPCLSFRFLTFQQTLELNTHPTHTQTYKQPEPPGVSALTSFLLPLSVCLATTLIGQPSNPH